MNNDEHTFTLRLPKVTPTRLLMFVRHCIGLSALGMAFTGAFLMVWLPLHDGYTSAFGLRVFLTGALQGAVFVILTIWVHARPDAKAHGLAGF